MINEIGTEHEIVSNHYNDSTNMELHIQLYKKFS